MIVSTSTRRLIKQVCQNLEEQMVKDLERNPDDAVAFIEDVREVAQVIFESDARSIWDIK